QRDERAPPHSITLSARPPLVPIDWLGTKMSDASSLQCEKLFAIQSRLAKQDASAQIDRLSLVKLISRFAEEAESPRSSDDAIDGRALGLAGSSRCARARACSRTGGQLRLAPWAR